MGIREKGLKFLVPKRNRMSDFKTSYLITRILTGKRDRTFLPFRNLARHERSAQPWKGIVLSRILSRAKWSRTRLCQSRFSEKSGSQRVQTNTGPRESSFFIVICSTAEFEALGERFCYHNDLGIRHIRPMRVCSTMIIPGWPKGGQGGLRVTLQDTREWFRTAMVRGWIPEEGTLMF